MLRLSVICRQLSECGTSGDVPVSPHDGHISIATTAAREESLGRRQSFAGQFCQVRADAPRDSRGVTAYAFWHKKNWTGNVHFNASTVAVPDSLAELQEVVRSGKAPLRVVGRGHSFTPVCECSGGTLVSLSSMNRVLGFSPPVVENGMPFAEGSVTVEGGITFTELIQYLREQDPPCALKNLSSVRQSTVAGACATGTHGSGIHNQNLASHVISIEFVCADGSTRKYHRRENPEETRSAAVNIGVLGVISKLEVEVVPIFRARVYFFSVKFSDLLEHWGDMVARSPALADSFSLWIGDWTKVDEFTGLPDPDVSVRLKEFLGHWDPSIAAASPANLKGKLWKTGHMLTEANGMPYPGFHDGKYENIVSVYYGPRQNGIETDLGDGAVHDCGQQAEFFIPMEHAVAALRAASMVLSKWPRSIAGEPVETTGIIDGVELRVVKGDPGWLSPQPVDCLGLHLSLIGVPARQAEIEERLVELETVLAQFNARPHWGKLATHTFTAARMAELYGAENMRKFKGMARSHDPGGKFRNAWITNTLGDF